MLRVIIVQTVLSLLLTAGGSQADDGRSSAAAFTPDPAAEQRFGRAYRFPQAGWIVLHIEGAPYERGYQHGRLLAPEIADYVKSIATLRSPKAPAEAWRDLRMIVGALFLRRYEPEYLEEMKGIADGATSAGAKFEGRSLDLVDIVAVNSNIEVEFLDNALDATATGLEGKRFPAPAAVQPRKAPQPHCSAFAAVGPATADGKIVFGHITMFNLYYVRHFNVWLDVQPSNGHRVLMQTYPGGIMSGMDYYFNDAGLLVAETTIAQTKFDETGLALASRIRKVLQYARGINDAVQILRSGNNGLYTNEWLLADTRTNEIAMLELGTHQSQLWRSSKNEWIGGTPGFYWGCNNAKSLAVRQETHASLTDKPANLVFRPSDRDETWQRLLNKHQGKIGVAFGFEAFTTPPLAAFSSCDAKFTTTALARELKTWAVFGPPLGRTWDPTDEQRTRNPDIRPLVNNDWALLSPELPATNSRSLACDLVPKAESGESKPDLPDVLPAAWRGSILPASDADIWLAVGFADYEKIVALEQALRQAAQGKDLGTEAHERLELAAFAPRSRYFAAAQRRGGDVPLAATRAELAHNEWYDLAANKGVLFLEQLREKLGPQAFEQKMDSFGRQNAGKAVATAAFRQQMESGQSASLDRLFSTWLQQKDPAGLLEGSYWSIDSFEAEPARALIIYGTRKERPAQQEAAERLQRKIARRWSNIAVPIKADTDVSDADLRSHHLLLIGRPDSNAVAARFARSLPVAFGPCSFTVRGKLYAHPASAILAAGNHPLTPRYSLVICAGLSADATWRCAQQYMDRGGAPAPALLLASFEKPRFLVLQPPRPAPPLQQASANSRQPPGG